MSTYVIYAYGGGNDGYFAANGTSFATAREHSGPSLSPGTTQLSAGTYTGGATTWYCYESALAFNTSNIAAGEAPTAAELSVVVTTIGGTPTIQARADDWTITLASADWTKGSVFGANTLLASRAPSATGRQSFTENGTAFADYLNLAGDTTIMVSDSTFASGVENGTQYANFYGADQAGTTDDPTLTVTASTPSTDATITVENAASSTADAPAPTVSAASTVTPPSMVATANALSPSVDAVANVSVEPPAATASADAPAPVVGVSAEVSAETASASATAPVPAVSGESPGVTVSAVPAQATASALAPAVEGQVPDYTYAVSVKRAGLSSDVMSGTLTSNAIRSAVSEDVLLDRHGFANTGG